MQKGNDYRWQITSWFGVDSWIFKILIKILIQLEDVLRNEKIQRYKFWFNDYQKLVQRKLFKRETYVNMP